MIFLECGTSYVMSRTSSMCYMVVTVHENIVLSFGRIKINLKIKFFFLFYSLNVEIQRLTKTNKCVDKEKN